MTIQVFQVPYDSGHRGLRMGRGPIHLVERGALDVLRQNDPDVRLVQVESTSSFPTEIGTSFELHRVLAEAVSAATRNGFWPVVLAGNCNSSIGTVSGLQAAHLDGGTGVVWLDGHGDCNTPETFTGDFLDAMGISTLTGRCWQALCRTIPGFRALPDEHMILVGGHGADHGARAVIQASGIQHVTTGAVLSRGAAGALGPALDIMRSRGVTRVYLHLDLDVLDATWARANQFAPEGGLLPDQVTACIDQIRSRFPIAAAAIASYDPAFDLQDLVLTSALAFCAQFAPCGSACMPETRELRL